MVGIMCLSADALVVSTSEYQHYLRERHTPENVFILMRQHPATINPENWVTHAKWITILYSRNICGILHPKEHSEKFNMIY